jgi:ABC-2 type transport system permease protein
VKDFFRRYLALATKEVQQLRRNKGLLIQLLLPPTIVLVIFGYAMNPKVRHLRLGVIDQDYTIQSRDFVNSLTENINFDVTQRFARASEAEAEMNRLKLDLFIVIPPDFTRNIERGQPAHVQVIIDAVDANMAQIGQGYLQRAVDSYNASTGLAPVADYRLLHSLNRAAHAPTPAGAVEVISAYLFNPGLDTSWFYVTGIMSILMFINASLVASALAVKEKETGTIEQLLMTPAQTGEMLLAKTSPVFVLLLIVLFIALGVAVVVFGLPVRGALWLFFVSGVCAALAGIGIGVMLATVSKSQQQAQLLTFFVNPPITLLAGASSPIENMPHFLQQLSYLDPLRYLVTIIRGVTVKDTPFSALWPNLAALAVFAVVLFSISAWRFRKQ